MNLSLLLAGALLLVLTALHIVVGERKYDRSQESKRVEGYVPYHQISSLLLIQSIGLLVSAFYDNPVLPLFVLVLILSNVLVFLLVSIRQKWYYALRDSIFQYIVLGFVIALTLLGIAV